MTMEKRKLTKEDIDKVRDIEGFPIGTDEDIIALSDPPYYTACPNPFIEDFIKEHGTPYDEETDDYHREPFASDVSEGKSDPIYNAHTYHTKVPYKAIMKYILHYTNPGDLVFDGFCGTGMTGVAASKCGDISKEICDSNSILWGARQAILSDISPVASLIAYNYSYCRDIDGFVESANRILGECEKELGWMYQTEGIANNSALHNSEFEMNYTAWSDVLICPHCSSELVFYNVAFFEDSGKVANVFSCRKCGAKLKKSDCNRAIYSYYDNTMDEVVTAIRQVPVVIDYCKDGHHYKKQPSLSDMAIIKKIDAMQIEEWYPTDLMMHLGEKWGDSWRSGYHSGITRVHHFFYKRTLAFLAKMNELIENENNPLLKIWFTSQLLNISKLNRYRPKVTFPYNPLSGTLYISSLVCESNPFIAYKGKIKKFADAFKGAKSNDNIISVCSATNLLIPNNSIDYIFSDPPFGDNLMYSELSFIWESWIKNQTNNKQEAIMNKSQQKGLFEYQSLMTSCFKEFFRVLKPNRWMTIEFHNSKNAVWNAIQQAIQVAGFIVADIRILDKQQGSYKQVNDNNAVKQDLVISAYKPKNSLLREFAQNAGTEETAWAFVRQHLSNLPVVVDANKNGKLDIIPERQAFLLFDRMVAYHIMQGLPVPIDASAFYKGIDDRFLKRDNMYFLPDQVNEYDLARSKCEIESVDISLFVTDEKSAIGWLYQQLDDKNGGKPQTYQVLQPKFMQEVKAVKKNEKMPELLVMLEENFLKDEKGRWYVPDLTKSGDMVKLREKNLLREFQEYQASKGKLKVFRSEAIRAGFAKLWKEKDYKAIVTLAERLPEETVQEDSNLLMYYDISLSRV